MDGESGFARAYSVASLEQTRGQLRTWWGRLMVATIGSSFAFLSLLVGQMLVLEPVRGDYFLEIIWRPASGAYWWNYPGVILVQPWGILALPFLPTIAMVLVSYGVGLGMSVAVLIGVRMFRSRRNALGRPVALGSATGLTPAMIALVTLGACCSTTAAATAGIGVAAQTSGTSIDTLLQNSWYLNVFQLVILWVALIAQEQLLVAYGIFFDPDSKVAAPAAADRFAFLKGAARLALLIGGITWSLSTLAAWAAGGWATAGAGDWIHWLFQQQLPALLAVAVALAPGGVLDGFARRADRLQGRAYRWLLGIAGLSLLAWTPPALALAGVYGWANELLGVLGANSSYGAVSVAPISGWGLVFHWGLQLGLLGVFSVAVALAPWRVLRAIAPADRPANAPLAVRAGAGSPERPPVAASTASEP